MCIKFLNKKSSSGFKLFTTIEEMNASTGNQKGDLALVYSTSMNNMIEGASANEMVLVENVEVKRPLGGGIVGLFDVVNEDSSIGINGMYIYGDVEVELTINGETSIISYTKIDDTHYHRDTEVINPIVSSTPLVYSGSSDYIGFVQAKMPMFGGVYQYSNEAWEIVSLPLDALPENVQKDILFYGKNGIETGSYVLPNIFVSADDMVEGRYVHWNDPNSFDTDGTLKDFRNGMGQFDPGGGREVYIKGNAALVNTDENQNLILQGLVNLIEQWTIGGIDKTSTEGGVINNTSIISISVSFSQIANFIGLTADKIKAGETILGVTGTYEGEK